MILDTFERYKHNLFLSPITSGTVENFGNRCGLTESSSVLDVACGKGGAALTLAEKFECVVTCVEPRAEFAEEARRRTVFGDLDHLVNILDSPADEFPFDDFYFDLALMLGNTCPLNFDKIVNELTRVVRRGGWIALSEIAWKPGAPDSATPSVIDWSKGFTPLRIAGLEKRTAEFIDAGFHVEFAELETDAAWENYYAPQARSIIENRLEYNGSAEAQTTLGEWRNELNRYHTGGGKESVGYACYLLRCP